MQPELLTNESILIYGGLVLTLIIIFSETAFPIGAIIQGGELLLLITGLIVGTKWLPINVLFVIIPVSLVAFIGDLTGYTLGHKWGVEIYKKKENLFFKEEYIRSAEKFKEQYRFISIIFGHFIPIIRTYTPLLNGIKETPFQLYFIFSGIGCVLYVNVFVFAGYFVGRIFPYLKIYLQYIIAVIVVYTFAYPLVSLLIAGSGKEKNIDHL